MTGGKAHEHDRRGGGRKFSCGWDQQANGSQRLGRGGDDHPLVAGHESQFPGLVTAQGWGNHRVVKLRRSKVIH